MRGEAWVEAWGRGCETGGAVRADTSHWLGYACSLSPTNATARVPKDLTRTASSLLASGWSKGVAMLSAKTHFQQVSLEIVRKIVDEQIRRETETEQAQGARQLTLEENFLPEQGQSTATSYKFSQEES
jgi:hypothetical protein